MQPAIPVFTFILTLCMGTEQIRLKQWSGVAKVGGTMACVSGAVLLALYKGPVVWGDDSFNMHNQNDHSLFALHMNLWQIGILCLIGNCFCFALYVALQAPLLKIYPASSSVTAASYAFATVFIVLSAFAGLSDWNDWILSSSEIMAVVFSGIVASALNYWLLTWSNKVVGPGIVSLYMPIQPLFSSIFSRIFLGSSIYVGSVLGALFIIVGLYSVTWGQMKSRSIDHYNDPMGRDFTDDISADGSLQTSLIKGN
ncbi:hypothetical protein KP509_25G032900 [Ceratopteris richardii]|nr:hypothetical protein KP509_25G032900 [Ceratopteris richardii]